MKWVVGAAAVFFVGCFTPVKERLSGRADAGVPDAGPFSSDAGHAKRGVRVGPIPPFAPDGGPVFVGDSATVDVAATNLDPEPVEVGLSIDPPFRVEPDQLVLQAGEASALRITFSPKVAGVAKAVLRVGSNDVDVGAWSVALRCRSLHCDDDNPCTIDTCTEATGCGYTTADDGTVCGVDDCKAEATDVCEAGSRVSRPRAPTGRCTNAWLADSMPARSQSAMVYDDARKKVVLFGGPHGDTWERTAETWAERYPANSPPAHHAVATYDRERKRTVAIVGEETWEWDGVTWLNRTPTLHPGLASMAVFDAARRVVVTLDVNGKTWAWDGRTWHERPSPEHPAANSATAAAYDERKQRVVLFGGFGPPPTFTPLDETWEWDGATWTQALTKTTPGWRASHQLAYDDIRHRLVLFGGNAGNPAHLDNSTWEWDGAEWHQMAPAVSPPARTQFAMTFDRDRQRTVLMGGTNQATGLSADTWEWDGTSWLPAGLEQSPPVVVTTATTYSPVIAYDVRRKVIVLQTMGTPAEPAQTWEWNGKLWVRRLPTTQPPPRRTASMAYDRARERVVLFGGEREGLEPLNDTWEWDGVNWAERTFPASPPAQGGAGMAYDSDRHLIVLYGSDATIWELNDRFWNWQPRPYNPGGWYGTSLTYDPTVRGFFLVGGNRAFDGQWFANTWWWNGSAWSPAWPMQEIDPRAWAAATYDANLKQVLIFGGIQFGGAFLADTWAHNQTTWLKLALNASLPGYYGPFFSSMVFDEERGRSTLINKYGVWHYEP